MTAETAGSTEHVPPAGQRYAALTFAGLTLVLPQSDIYTLEPHSDVKPNPHGNRIVGWIEAGGSLRPVVCFAGDLTLMTESPGNRHVCVMLNTAQGYVGVLCEVVKTLEPEHSRIFTLPAAMRLPGSPVRGLVLHPGLFGCLTTSADLQALLPDLETADLMSSSGTSIAAEARP